MVADHRAGDGAGCGRCDLAVAAAHLATQQGAGDAADHGATGAALLLDRGLYVLGAAFLARHTHLLYARLDADDAAEVIKISSLRQRKGGKAECGNQEFGLEFH
ncbi:hypothetical protein GCM10027321_16880 [Massilia terrae]